MTEVAMSDLAKEASDAHRMLDALGIERTFESNGKELTVRERIMRLQWRDKEEIRKSVRKVLGSMEEVERSLRK